MKFLLITFASLLVLSATATTPIVVEAPIDHVFVPEGFDNNDHVEIVVTGKFPNLCYTKNSYMVKVVGDVIKIDISSLSKDDPNRAKCEPLKVPFTEVINVGNLQGGDYTIKVNEGGARAQTSKINVSVASSQSVDDNIYAMVDYVDLGFTGGLSGSATLVAKNPSPCLVLDRVDYITNKKDVVSVLPIMKKVSADCPEKSSSFEIPVTFDRALLKNGQVMLFVRTIEGRSVHSIVTP